MKKTAKYPFRAELTKGWLKPTLEQAVADRQTWPSWQKGEAEPTEREQNDD